MGFLFTRRMPAALCRRGPCCLTKNSRQTTIAWDSFRELPDGFFLRWAHPVVYKAGCDWFARALSELKGWEVSVIRPWHETDDPAVSCQKAPPQPTPRRPPQPTPTAVEKTPAPATAADAGGAVAAEATAAAPRKRRRHTGKQNPPPPVWCFSPTLKLARGRRDLSRDAALYAVSAEEMLEGSLHDFRRGERDGREVLLKTRRRPGKPNANMRASLPEIALLERCRGQATLSQLLDVFMADGRHVTQVLEPFGQPLDAVLALFGEGPWGGASCGAAPARDVQPDTPEGSVARMPAPEALLDPRVWLTPGQVRIIVKDVVEGLRFLHGQCGVLHGALSLSHILWCGGHARLTDLRAATEVSHTYVCFVGCAPLGQPSPAALNGASR